MKPELLLPVGNTEMCMAAIHHGADAVYIGAPYFNARKRTTDFSIEELKEMIDYCHLYGVKVNLALNVVIFQNELPQVIKLLEDILPLGPDAIIVQDLGLAQIIRKMSPLQKIHASTQMTVTNTDAMNLIEDLGIQRFVLGRENSLAEMKLMREQTNKELEVFVHGALCVAYSGQCFTSESLGGRSANRGQCAQSCRLDYELWVDEKKKEMGDKKYLVSPKDLMGLSDIPALMELGIHSFKVEGRLKTPEYVASAARNYRQAIDGKKIDLKQSELELSTTYSRGFFSGWLHGVDHQNLVDGTYSAHRGLKIGKVLKIQGRKIIISSSISLHSGQGLLFVKDKEVGAKIFSAKKISSDSFEVELVKKDIKISSQSDVFINSDETLDRKLQKQWQARELQKKIPLEMVIKGKKGERLHVLAVDPQGRRVEITSEELLSESEREQDMLMRSELTALSATVYEVTKFESQIQGKVFLHQREIKKIRRQMVELMNENRIKYEVNVSSFTLPEMEKKCVSQIKLNLLLRNKEQVQAFVENYELQTFKGLESFIGEVILDFEFGKDYQASLDLLRSKNITCVIATTRILKPSEYYNLKTLIRLSPDKILVRNLGALEYLRKNSSITLVGDFSLNVTNSLSANYLISKGLERVTLSYDLNQSQLIDLVNAFNPSLLEMTLHQYMPEFHMEHCVFAAFLSKGKSFRDCGKPCEKHQVKLKDPYGNWHFLKADHECRNTFFKGAPQSASFLVDELKQLGFGMFRLEALDESREVLMQKILAYLRLLKGEITSEEVVKNLKLNEIYGLGEGQLNRTDDYQDRKKTKVQSPLF